MLNLSQDLQYFEVPGAKIAFDFFPSREECKKLLVLVNGYQRTRQDFRAFRKRIQSQSPFVATLALDNRYCGQTEVLEDTPSEGLIEVMAQDAFSLGQIFAQKLSLTQFSILGISMGGMIAQSVAAAFPQSLEHLFLVSTTSGGEGRFYPSYVKDPHKIAYKEFQTEEELRKSMGRYFAQRFLKNSPLLFDMMIKSMFSLNQRPQVSAAAQRQFYASLRFDGVAQLSKIRAKTCIFSGDEDGIIPIENAYFLKNAIPSSSFKLYNETGHLLLIEEPELFARDVLNFLENS